ncbi:MAG: ATP-binding cassette domain-containing protein, partial [Candidatus Paceibacterota bacterium]
MSAPTSKQKETFTDPVCGISLSESTGHPLSVGSKEIQFCGDQCRDRFKSNPEKFSGEPILKISNVWKIFGTGEARTEVLKGININVWKGDFVAIIGSSGSGKSTTLNMVGLLDKPSKGQVLLRGKDIAVLSDDERAKLRSITFGFVFQQYNLLPWLTAEENVKMPLLFSGKILSDEKIHEHFKSVNLENRMDHCPLEMSGGEQQRTAFLRAVINDPEIILGDEPTGNLDSETGNKLLDL